MPDNDALPLWLGGHLTESKENLHPDAPDPCLRPEDFAAELEHHGWLLRSGYTRIAFCHGKDGWEHLFVNGREFGLSSGSKGFLHAITQEHRLHHGYLAEWLEEPECLDLLCRLYNEGYYEFPDA